MSMSQKLPPEERKKYMSINLPVDMVEQLRRIRLDASKRFGRNVTYEELLAQMIRRFCLLYQRPNFKL